MTVGAVLPRAFYARPTLEVARDLIGKRLVHVTPRGAAAGVIVEVEAYVGEGDPACHAAAGLTRRNAPLYGPPGRAYVYVNYGLHHLVNAVTEPEGAPAAVLIRALEPVGGAALMRCRRARDAGRRATPLTDPDLCRGPGNLTSALGITLRQNRCDLSGSRLFVEDCGSFEGALAWSPRIGIAVGADRPWRCYAAASPYVSARGRARAAVAGAGAGAEAIAGARGKPGPRRSGARLRG